MTKLGAKLLTLTIKTPHKRTFVYKFISNNQFAGDTLKREKAIEKLLHYAHNYLTKPNLAVIHLSGGLGNQMYNYTFGKALESKGYDVIFDASDYKNLQGDSQNGGGGIVHKMTQIKIARILTPKIPQNPLISVI